MTVAGGANSVETAMTDAAGFLAQSLKSLLGTTFDVLSTISSPDIGSAGFLSTYAAGSGIALFVLAVMLGRLFYRTSSGDMSGQALAESLWRWAPTAMLLVVFGPGLGQLAVQLVDAGTKSIIGYFGADVHDLSGRLTSMVVIGDPSQLPGGPILALLVMAVAFVGLAGIVGGLVAQTLALYLTGAVMAVAFVAMIDPSTRALALRLPSAWGGLLLAKPVLFFLIGAIARLAGSAFASSPGTDPGWRLLMPALMGALALLLVGLAPWSLLRFAPRMPTARHERTAHALRAAETREQQPSSAMLQMSYRRMHGILAGQSAAPLTGTVAVPPGGSRQIDTARARVPHPDTPSAEQPQAAHAADATADLTALVPFNEQAIDAAPPPMPEFVHRGRHQ
jgi:hypothetical protein